MRLTHDFDRRASAIARMYPSMCGPSDQRSSHAARPRAAELVAERPIDAQPVDRLDELVGGAKRQPAPESAMSSGRAPRSLTIAGVPWANASSTTMPNTS